MTPDHGAHPHSHDAHAQANHHGAVDSALLASRRGIWAVQWSGIALLATALFQVAVVVFSGSVALLADTIHNFGDAFTAVPLWFAFQLAQRKPGKSFTYGYGRMEDLAGVGIVLVVLGGAVFSGFTAWDRLIHPQPVSHLWAVLIASLVGFLGNEAVALFRIRVGREIGSVVLAADGLHARADGLTSLAVFVGAAGAWMGYPVADPIVGLLITVAVLSIAWTTGKSVFSRLIDQVDPAVVAEIREVAGGTSGVEDVKEIRVRWIGHRLQAEINIAVAPDMPVSEGHEIAEAVRHEILHSLPYLSYGTIHVDPVTQSGEAHHRIDEHQHGEHPEHSH